jgi:chemotaxis protein CheD
MAALPQPGSAAAGGRPVVYLHPGQLFAGAEPVDVTTILGSCVSTCLWDPRARMGAINHFLLPSGDAEGEPSARFGDVAVRMVVEMLLARGSRVRDLQAKLFGGACVVHGVTRDDHLGAKNVAAARALLDRYGVPVVAADVGGRCGRKLVYRTDSGLALVKVMG